MWVHRTLGRYQLVLLLPAMAFALTAVAVTSSLANDEVAGLALTFVPIRWCVIGHDLNGNGKFDADTGEDGVPAFVNGNTDDVLLKKEIIASERVWIPGASIAFRPKIGVHRLAAGVRASATAAAPPAVEHLYQVIADPCPPSTAGCGGSYGDIAGDPSSSYATEELEDAWAACAAAWENVGVHDGVIVVNLGRFVNELDTYGKTDYPKDCNAALLGPFCTDPTQTQGFAAGKVAIIDGSFIPGGDPNEQVLAHELGHALMLGHGDGVDNNGNGVFDECCDNSEPSGAVPTSLMNPQYGDQPDYLAVRDLQKAVVQSVVKTIPGIRVDPPAMITDGDTTGGTRVDAVHDVADSAIDIVTVGITIDNVRALTILSQTLFRGVPDRVQDRYAIFVDADDDAGTGGSPADLGFATAFTGAEFVGSVFIDTTQEFPAISGKFWRFETGHFAEVDESRIGVDLFTSTEAETGVPLFGHVSVRVPNDLRGPIAQNIRIQAIAENLVPGGQQDQLPDGPQDGGAAFSFAPQPPLECTVTPSLIQPGATVTVGATGLVPNQRATVLLGDQTVGTGPTDTGGQASIDVVVPGGATMGARLVAVVIQGTGAVATCALKVVGGPVECGDGIIGPGETCDPPSATINPERGVPLCRPDCTFCGDGKVEAGETCDDGNLLECDPVHPQTPLDSCNNRCQGLICRDPGRITLGPGLGALKLHARMIPIGGGAINFATSPISLTTTTGPTLVYQAGIPAGTIGGLPSGTFRYVDTGSREHGGIYELKAIRTSHGYKITLLAYGDLSQAADDMITEIDVGDQKWAIHGLWKRTLTGWLFNAKSVLLP